MKEFLTKVKNQLNTSHFWDKALKFCPKLECPKYKCPKFLVFNAVLVGLNEILADRSSTWFVQAVVGEEPLGTKTSKKDEKSKYLKP